MLRCKTTPLTEKQTNDYIIERLRIAGSDGKPIFSPQAIAIIHKYSSGIPRVVNLLCEHSLINAYVEQQRPILATIAEDVAHEFQLDEVAPDGRGLALAGTYQKHAGLNAEMKVLSLAEVTDEVEKPASTTGSDAQIAFAKSTRVDADASMSTSLYTSTWFIQNFSEAFSRFRISPTMTPPREEPPRPAITLTWPTSARQR